jgi:hypothetical protein
VFILTNPTEVEICIYVEQHTLKLLYVFILLFFSLSASLVPNINKFTATQIFDFPELSMRKIILRQLFPFAFSKQRSLSLNAAGCLLYNTATRCGYKV